MTGGGIDLLDVDLDMNSTVSYPAIQPAIEPSSNVHPDRALLMIVSLSTDSRDTQDDSNCANQEEPPATRNLYLDDSFAHRPIKRLPRRHRRSRNCYPQPNRLHSDHYRLRYSPRDCSPGSRLGRYQRYSPRRGRNDSRDNSSRFPAHSTEAQLVAAMADLDVRSDERDDRRDRGRNRGNKRRRDGKLEGPSHSHVLKKRFTRV